MEQLAESPEPQTPEAQPVPVEAEAPVDIRVEPQVETPTEAEAEPQAPQETETLAVSFSAEEILGDEQPEPSDAAVSVGDSQLLAVLEAIIYVTDEPLTLDQIAEATEQPRERISSLLEQLCAEYDRPERGLSIREVAGGFRMTTKPEHHEAVRRFVRNLNPPVKLSLPALETLAVIAYKQPITAPEIMDIRGVQGAGVLKTLLDRKLIAAAGRKQVVGKPILYKTTKEFLVQFGLKNLQELPTLKEFQEIGSLSGGEPEGPVQANLIEMPAPPDESEESGDLIADTDVQTSDETEQQH
jgi:segregation and condensation protein B